MCYWRHFAAAQVRYECGWYLVMIAETKIVRSDVIFVAGCVVAYVATTLLMTPYVALIEPDSHGYLSFEANRSALYPALLYVCRAMGLGLVQITWLQTGLFGAALAYLLIALRKAGFSRLLLALLVAVLAANLLFTSFHRSILTESIYFSLGVVATGLWIDYFRTGRAPLLAFAGLALGLMIGFRPVGVALVPMQLIAVWIRRPVAAARWLAIVIAVIAVGVGAGSERLLYRAVHDGPPRSTAPLLLMGKAAMLIKPAMTFSGPHAEALQAAGALVYRQFLPLQQVLENAPSIAVRAQLAAAYEGQAQDDAFLQRELTNIAAKTQITVDVLRAELGKQVMLRNLPGYVTLFAVTEIGQWSVSAQHFPPTSRMIADYADTNPAVSYGGSIPQDMLHPQPWRSAFIVYPAFLIAGAVTLVLAVGIFVFMARPALLAGRTGFYLGLAVFLSAMCHAYTMFISLANVWTPRFLMAVFPQLEIIALCLIMVAVGCWRGMRRLV